MPPRLRRADCSGPGIRRRRRGRGLRLRRRRGPARRRARGAAADRRARDPARLGGRVDLPVPERAPAGDRHRRRRAQAVPLPRRMAYAARRARSSTTWSASPRRCRGCAGGSSATSATASRSTAAACWPPRCGCSSVGFFRIGSEEYATENESYGLATLRKEHVRIEDGVDGVRLPRQERPAAAPGDLRRAAARRSSPRLQSDGAAAATSCWPTSSAVAGTTSAPRTSTTTSRTRPAGNSPPRTSAPGTRPRWRRWRWRCRARRPAREPRASGRSSARSRRSRATSATRPPSAAPPTSTRACSTPTPPG